MVTTTDPNTPDILPPDDLMPKQPSDPAVGAPPTTKWKHAFMFAMGQLIRQARMAWQKKTGKSIDDLLAKCGTGYSTYYAYESGRSCPTAWMLANIAWAMEIPIESLFPDEW